MENSPFLNAMSLRCIRSGCLPPAVSGGADCHCNEPSEGVHVTRSAASQRSWPPDGHFVLPVVGVLVPKIRAESLAEE